MATDVPGAGDLLPAILREGVRGLADVVRSEAIRQAPVETGALRASPPPISEADGTLHQSGYVMEAKIVFPLVYAARQHEETTWQHPKGGKAKYLEDPMKEMAGKFDRRLGGYISKCLSARRVVPFQTLGR